MSEPAGEPQDYLESLGFAKPFFLGADFSPVLLKWANELLNEAQDLCGLRDMKVVFLGIRATADGPKMYWFKYPENSWLILLNNTPGYDSPVHWYFQLAHEIIHFLSPCKGMALNLEEGIATVFAERMLSKNFNGIGEGWTGNGPYRKPYEIVKEVLRQNPRAVLGLRKIRPHFDDHTAETILEAWPSLSRENAEFLATRFVSEPRIPASGDDRATP